MNTIIKNQKQAANTRKKIAELLLTDKELEDNKKQYSTVKYLLAKNSLNGLISELKSQLDFYESLIEGKISYLKSTNFKNISKILIATRLSKKMSQKELADKIGIQEQQIQRYEMEDYEGASLTRIVEVVMALDIELQFENVQLFSTSESFHLPKNYLINNVLLFQEKIKREKSFSLMCNL